MSRHHTLCSAALSPSATPIVVVKQGPLSALFSNFFSFFPVY